MHDHDAEVAVLAAIVESKTARQEARRHISGGDLYEPWHEVIWDAVARLDRTAAPSTQSPSTRFSLPGSRASRDARRHPTIPLPDSVAEHAAIVRSWATKRRIQTTASQVVAQALNPNATPPGSPHLWQPSSPPSETPAPPRTTDGALRLRAATPADDEPDWLIPGLLERRDRLMLTGEEGLGK